LLFWVTIGAEALWQKAAIYADSEDWMMIDFLFAMLAAGINGASDGSAQDRPSAVTQAPAAAGVTASVPVLPVPTPPAAPNGFNMAVVPAGLSAEPQAPLGKFTTATEIKPILEATKTNWVAVRQYDGKDLLYITHLWSWRCGLAAIAVSVNGEAMQNWPMPPCHTDLSTPNAIQEGDGFPYLSLREGAVQTITVQIVYDDLSMDVASFDRGAVLIP
tara:strand:+ start:1035 stop:1685 length:651 start_codon:yes stop_codon:yes gene_type:complete